MITELSAGVYADFGEPVVLRKSDGSAVISTKGLYDEAATDYTTEHARVRSRQPELTVAASATSGYGEGDIAELRGKQWEILDAVDDGEVVTFTLSESYD